METRNLGMLAALALAGGNGPIDDILEPEPVDVVRRPEPMRNGWTPIDKGHRVTDFTGKTGGKRERERRLKQLAKRSRNHE